MHYSGDANKTGNASRRAAVFVDYDNLFLHLYERMGPRSRPDDVITEVVQELKRYLMQESRTSTAVVAAYADFSEMHGNGQRIQRGLYLHGIEPRFVPGAMQRNAAEIQLCLDAAETLYNRQDIDTIAIVTGDRPYLPLVQHCNRRGSRALIATFSPPSSAGQSSHVDDDVFLPAMNLLGDTSRRSLSSPRPVHRPAPPPPAPRKSPVDYIEIEHPGARRALQIIDEHFGQYPEIYLTPLLRKLSELLDDDRYDPKSLISELENAGAVWLEKRRGFPYDYTVLLIDTQHPDVQELQQRDHRADAPGAVPYDEGARYAEPYPDEEQGEYDDPNEYDEGYEDEYDDEAESYPDGSAQGSIFDSGDNSY